MPNEVLDFFDHSVSAPTSSAYIQQRKKILTEAWDFLFHLFEQANSPLSDISQYGFHIYACDGSDDNICRNPDDEETFIHEGEKGYKAIHINAPYQCFERQNSKKYVIFLSNLQLFHMFQTLP